jgi:hypothetical protein
MPASLIILPQIPALHAGFTGIVVDLSGQCAIFLGLKKSLSNPHG